jgi:hypothetical protein
MKEAYYKHKKHHKLVLPHFYHSINVTVFKKLKVRKLLSNIVKVPNWIRIVRTQITRYGKYYSQNNNEHATAKKLWLEHKAEALKMLKNSDELAHMGLLILANIYFKMQQENKLSASIYIQARKILAGAIVNATATLRTLQTATPIAKKVQNIKLMLKYKKYTPAQIKSKQATLKRLHPKFIEIQRTSVSMIEHMRKIQHNVRLFTKTMIKRRKLLKNIKNLTEAMGKVVNDLIKFSKLHDKPKEIKFNNAITVIKRSLYWNYYYLAMINENLTEIFAHLSSLKQHVNQRIKYSRTQIGIAKMNVEEEKRSLKMQNKELNVKISQTKRDLHNLEKSQKKTGHLKVSDADKQKVQVLKNQVTELVKQKVEIKKGYSSAFLEAKKAVEHMKKNPSKFSDPVYRKKTCFNRIAKYKKKFYPSMAKMLNHRKDYQLAYKNKASKKTLKNKKAAYKWYDMQKSLFWSLIEACQSDVSNELLILNGGLPEIKCVSESKAKCVAGFKAKIATELKNYKKAVGIYSNLTGKYTPKEIKAQVVIARSGLEITELKSLMAECSDVKCNKGAETIAHKFEGYVKPKIIVPCKANEVRVAGLCNKKPKCVPMTKETCSSLKDEEIKQNQKDILTKKREIDELKKDKQKVQKLKDTETALAELMKKDKIIFGAKKLCVDVKCEVIKVLKPKLPPKCVPESKKVCRIKYMKLIKNTKAKIMSHEESKRKYDTGKIPNKLASDKEELSLKKLRPELKKYQIALKKCQDTSCPGHIIKPNTKLVDAIKKKLVAEHTHKKVKEELRGLITVSEETTIEEVTIQSTTQIVSIMETTIVEVTQEITIIEEQIVTETKNGNLAKVNKLKEKHQKKHKHLAKHNKKLHKAKKNHAKVISKVAKHKQLHSQLTEVYEEITIIEVHITEIQDDPRQLMELEQQKAEKTKFKEHTEKAKKHAFEHLKNHHKKFTAQVKSEKVNKISYGQQSQITEVIEMHEEIIEVTEVHIVEYEKAGNSAMVEELKKKLDHHKEQHRQAHKKIHHIKKDTKHKKAAIKAPNQNQMHNVASKSVEKIKHMIKKKNHHAKLQKKVDSHKRLLAKAKLLKDESMITYYTTEVETVEVEIVEVVEIIQTSETVIETVESEVEVSTIKSATSTITTELIPAFHARMSAEISLKKANKESQESNHKLEQIKKDPRATKADIALAENVAKESEKKVVDNKEVHQKIFQHLSKTHKKVMAHKADHEIKNHLKNLVKHMKEKTAHENKLDHHKAELSKAKTELAKAKATGDDTLLEHWSSVVSETIVTVEEITTVVVEYQETVFTQIDVVETSHSTAKTLEVKLRASDKRQQTNNLKLNVNGAKIKANGLRMKLAAAKNMSLAQRKLQGKSNKAHEAEVKSLTIEIRLAQTEYVHYTSEVTIVTEELVTVTQEETVEETTVRNGQIKNANGIIKQTQISIDSFKSDITNANKQIAKHKKELKAADKKNLAESVKLRIRLSIEKQETKLPKLHQKVSIQQKKVFKHISHKNKSMVKKHKSNIKNAKKTIQAAKDKHILLTKEIEEKQKLLVIKKQTDPQFAIILEQQIDAVTITITETINVIEVHTELIEISVSSQYSIQSRKFNESEKIHLEMVKTSEKHKKDLKKSISKNKLELKTALFTKKDKVASAKLVKKLKLLKKQVSHQDKKIEKSKKKAEVCQNKAKLMKAKASLKLSQHKKSNANKKTDDIQTIKRIKLEMLTAGRVKKNNLRWQWTVLERKMKANKHIGKKMGKKAVKDAKKVNKLKEKVERKSLSTKSGSKQIVLKAKASANKLLNQAKLAFKKAQLKKNPKELVMAKKMVINAERTKKKVLKTAKKQAKTADKKHKKIIKAQVKHLHKHKAKVHKNLKKVSLEIKHLKAKLRAKLSKDEDLKLKIQLKEKLASKSDYVLEITTIVEDIYIRLPPIEQTVISTVHQDVFYRANASISNQASYDIVSCEDTIVTTTVEITTIETQLVTIMQGEGSVEEKKAKALKLNFKKTKLHAKVKKAHKINAKAHAKKRVALKKNKKIVAKKVHKAKKIHKIAKKLAIKAGKKAHKKVKKAKKLIKKLEKKIINAPTIAIKIALKKKLIRNEKAHSKMVKAHAKKVKKAKKAIHKAKLKALIKPKITHKKLRKAIKHLKPHRQHQIIKQAHDQAIQYTVVVTEEIQTTIEVTQETVAEIQHTEVIYTAAIEEVQIFETMVITAESSKDAKKVKVLKAEVALKKKNVDKHKKAIHHLKKKHAHLSKKQKKLNLHKAHSLKKVHQMAKLKIRAVKGMKRVAVQKKSHAKKQLGKQKRNLVKAKAILAKAIASKAESSAIEVIKSQIVEQQTTVETIYETVEVFTTEIVTSITTITTEVADRKSMHKQIKAQLKQYGHGSTDYMAKVESTLVTSSVTTSVETTVEETSITVETSTTVTEGRLLGGSKSRKLTISKARRDMIATLLGVTLDSNVRKLELNVEN